MEKSVVHLTKSFSCNGSNKPRIGRARKSLPSLGSRHARFASDSSAVVCCKRRYAPGALHVAREFGRRRRLREDSAVPARGRREYADGCASENDWQGKGRRQVRQREETLQRGLQANFVQNPRNAGDTYPAETAQKAGKSFPECTGAGGADLAAENEESLRIGIRGGPGQSAASTPTLGGTSPTTPSIKQRKSAGSSGYGRGDHQEQLARRE
jgi:hypothetical protein